LSSSEQLRLCPATVVTTDRKSGKDDKNSQQAEKDTVKSAVIAVPTTVASATVIAANVSSASLFEERERQITEQVKRQVRNIHYLLYIYSLCDYYIYNNILASGSETDITGA